MQNSRKRIPSLDGLRALSIALVLIGHAHFTTSFLQHSRVWYYIGNGDLGVSIFFVFSGFLITSLLLRENAEQGAISLSNFYIRRFYRIVPPFYVYLGTILVVSTFHYISVDRLSLLKAAAFTTDYTPTVWYLAHSWSLSVEEQFYLLWPATLKVLGHRKALRVSLVIICVAPVFRAISYFLFPGRRPDLPYMFQNRIDGLMFGCALAMVIDFAAFRRLWSRWLNSGVAMLATVFLFVVSPTLRILFQGKYLMLAGYSLESATIAYLLLYAIVRHQAAAGRILNMRVVAHIGVLSYSLYLWQQFCFGGLFRFPLSILLAFAAAQISYSTVERFSLLLRNYTEDYRNGRKALLERSAVA